MILPNPWNAKRIASDDVEALQEVQELVLVDGAVPVLVVGLERRFGDGGAAQIVVLDETAHLDMSVSRNQRVE